MELTTTTVDRSFWVAKDESISATVEFFWPTATYTHNTSVWFRIASTAAVVLHHLRHAA